MSDTTTIEIREDQRDALRDLKKFDRETYKEVLDRLLNGEDTPADNINMDFSNIDTDKLPLDVPNDLQEQLERIESGVKEATNAAQSADKKLEDLGR